MNNLLLIDSRVTDYQTIIAASNSSTTFQVFDYKNDTISDILDKINGDYECVAIVQHATKLPTYKLVSSMKAGIAKHVSTDDPLLLSWSNFIEFVNTLKVKHNVKHLDLLACSLYARKSWRYIITKLQTDLGIDIRASRDDTGSTALGGNWFLESDNINVKDVYFTDKINEYTGLLAGTYSEHSVIITKTDGVTYALSSGLGDDGQLGHNTTYVDGSIDGSMYNQNVENVDYDYLENVKYVSVGEDHTVILLENGVVKTTGSNNDGQLGLNTLDDKNRTISVIGDKNGKTILTGVKQVSAGSNHTLFLMNDGTVKSCGDNDNYKLGRGLINDHYGCMYPKDVLIQTQSGYSKLKGVKQVSAGANHSVFLMNDGSVMACGYNYYGQLGIGEDWQYDDIPCPTNVLLDNGDGTYPKPKLTNVVQVSAGSDHTLFLLASGKAMSCGSNDEGQLGVNDSCSDNYYYPDFVLDGTTGDELASIVQVSAGDYFSAFLLSNGKVKSTGYNDFGQLSNDSTNERSYTDYMMLSHTEADSAADPPVVESWVELTDIIQISANCNYILLLKSSNTGLGVGANYYGQLGINSRDNVSLPVGIRNNSNVDLTNIYCLTNVDNNSIFTVTLATTSPRRKNQTIVMNITYNGFNSANSYNLRIKDGADVCDSSFSPSIGYTEQDIVIPRSGDVTIELYDVRTSITLGSKVFKIRA
jgi:alpha-tubulin suppressor-like RCC1 family protein